ncbi:glycosyltransferase [Desulfogranum japonicum]|uniref:glycosyltransferase n=1 Tax=Desulfogranum japonicum TaxID=231447 RepID=UPI0003FF6C1E|nr:glycosyltransferase [Desulfogranum japonicum]
MRHLAERHGAIEYISFSRNFGKEAALAAGLNYCTADAVATIDADLQSPPELISQMIEKLEQEGADVGGRQKELP